MTTRTAIFLQPASGAARLSLSTRFEPHRQRHAQAVAWRLMANLQCKEL
jgi:hypothetical protein